MMTAPGPVRPLPGVVAAQRRVLWVGAPGEPWLGLSQAARALGCEAAQVPSLEGVVVELARTRPALVLVHWRLVPPRVSGSLAGLRARAAGLGVPVVLVAEPDTPAEVLETAEAEGMEDCLLAPLSAAGLRSRLEALTGERPGRASPRYSPRVVLLVGAGGARAWGGLGALLEACGHHLLYSATQDAAAARVAEHGAAPHLVLVPGDGAPSWGRPLFMLARSQPLLEAVRVLPVPVEAGPRAPGLLSRIHALLDRDLASLRAEERLPFCCPVEFGESGPRPGEWLSGFSTALSPGGLFVRTLVPARPGSAVGLRILLPTTREQLETHGVVAWANPFAPRGATVYPYGMGVRFLGMGPPRLMRLRQLCQPAAAPP